MKKMVSVVLAAILAVCLAACQGQTQPAAPSSAPASSAASVTEESEPASASEESVPEEELVEEEPEPVPVEMVADETSITLVSDGTTLVTFTMPGDSPIYYKLTVDDSGTTAVMTHDIMEGIAGRTIAELFEGSSQEYIDFYKSMVGIDEAGETLTKDLSGREVLIAKQVDEPGDDGRYDVRYLVAVPVADGVVLGFRIDAVNDTDNSVVFDDSTVDLLLSNCAF